MSYSYVQILCESFVGFGSGDALKWCILSFDTVDIIRTYCRYIVGDCVLARGREYAARDATQNSIPVAKCYTTAV